MTEFGQLDTSGDVIVPAPRSRAHEQGTCWRCHRTECICVIYEDQAAKTYSGCTPDKHKASRTIEWAPGIKVRTCACGQSVWA